MRAFKPLFVWMSAAALALAALPATGRGGGPPGVPGPGIGGHPDVGPDGHGRGVGRDHGPDHATGLARAIERHEANHARRLARLDRVRDIAMSKGDTKMVARVDRMIKDENSHFTHLMDTMHKAETAGGGGK